MEIQYERIGRPFILVRFPVLNLIPKREPSYRMAFFLMEARGVVLSSHYGEDHYFTITECVIPCHTSGLEARALNHIVKNWYGKSIENSHGWMDELGWSGRITYVLANDRKIYEVFLRIAKARDGRNILYGLNLDKNNGIAVDESATSKRAAVIAAMPSGQRITHPVGKVKAKSGGIQKQERSVGGSNREILANAFEEVAQTPYERSKAEEQRKELVESAGNLAADEE